MGRSRSRTPCRQITSPPENIQVVGTSTCKQEIEHLTGRAAEVRKSGLIARDAGSTLDFEALSVSMAHRGWVEKAALVFKQYRVLILNGLFSEETTDIILKGLEELHEKWSAKYDPDGHGNRLAGRYELMGAFDTWHLTHLPGYLQALEEFARKGGLQLLEAIGNYKFVGGHAHLCLAGTRNWQPLHSDFVHPGPYETYPLWDHPAHVPFIDLLFTLHPLTSNNAALRVIPNVPSIEATYYQFNPGGTRPPSLEKELDIYKRAGLFPLPAGCGILRDLRIWHGGTPNTSQEDRYTAVLRFYSCWSLDMWKEKVYEKKGVDPEEMQKHLSPATQEVVSKHIVRGKEDPQPKLVDFEGWPLQYDGWAHAYDKPRSNPRFYATLDD